MTLLCHSASSLSHMNSHTACTIKLQLMFPSSCNPHPDLAWCILTLPPNVSIPTVTLRIIITTGLLANAIQHLATYQACHHPILCLRMHIPYSGATPDIHHNEHERAQSSPFREWGVDKSGQINTMLVSCFCCNTVCPLTLYIHTRCYWFTLFGDISGSWSH